MECYFLLGAYKKIFRKLMEDLDNSYTHEEDRYPKTIIEVYKLLVNCK